MSLAPNAGRSLNPRQTYGVAQSLTGSSIPKQHCNKIFPGEDAKHPERPALGWPPPGAEAWPPEAKAAKPPRLKTFRLRRPPLSPAEATRSPTWTLGCFASFFFSLTCLSGIDPLGFGVSNLVARFFPTSISSLVIPCWVLDLLLPRANIGRGDTGWLLIFPHIIPPAPLTS